MEDNKIESLDRLEFNFNTGIKKICLSIAHKDLDKFAEMIYNMCIDYKIEATLKEIKEELADEGN